MECYNDEGQLIKYHCDYTISTEYGHFSHTSNSGYKLKKSKQTDTINCEKQMYQFNFKLNKELKEKTTNIEIYDNLWTLLGYNVKSLINGEWTWIAPINQELANTDLIVIFSYPKELNEEDIIKIKSNPLSRKPMVKIYSIKIHVNEFI